MKQKISMTLFALILATSISFSQTFPTIATGIFDDFNGTNTQSILVAQRSSVAFPLVPSAGTTFIYFGANASVSASGANEFELGGVDITNYTGNQLSDVMIGLTGLGFWSQNIPGTVFSYYTWNAATQSFTGSVGAGGSTKIATFKILGASVNGTALPLSALSILPLKNNASGYTFAEGSTSFSASFLDAGTGITHTASDAISTPNNIVYLRLGALANGATITNLRLKVGLYFQGGGDAWVDYPTDGSPAGDYDYYVQTQLDLYGCTYDYGDAPVSYGTAGHAPGLGNNAVYIGPNRQDYEGTQSGNTAANLDDNNLTGYNDETTGIPNCDILQPSYSLTLLPYVNRTGGQAAFSTWIDWNKDGVFQTDEMAITSVMPGSGNATFIWRKAGAGVGEGIIPLSVGVGTTYCRSRIGTIYSEIVLPTGFASDGEVEDFPIIIDNSLPITLVSFDAYSHNSQNELKWVTSTEDLGDLFEIERSLNGNTFLKMATVNARGINISIQNYTYVDANPSIGDNYYRLKYSSVDGKIAYSMVRKLVTENHFAFTIFPNPLTDVVTLSGLQKNMQVTMYSQTGQYLFKASVSSSTLSITMKGFANGSYMIVVTDEFGQKLSSSIVVKQ